MENMKINIVADDLTSAADASLPFMERGIHCKLLLNTHHKRGSAKAIALDVNSRGMAESEAEKAMEEAVRDRSDGLLIKTIDSTLRGHIKTEIYAAFRASGKSKVVVAPAFPDAGRTTLNGYQYVNGVHVSQSSYAMDPVHPASTSDIRDLIDSSLGKTAIVSEDESVNTFVRTLQESDVLILDAQSQNALDRLVSYVGLVADYKDILWVGSPGICYALAQVTGVNEQGIISELASRRVMAVVGSANVVSRKQRDYLVNKRISDEILTVFSSPDEANAAPHTICSDLAGRAAAKFVEQDFDALIVTGGETARAILSELNVCSLRITGQIEKGFPVYSCKIMQRETDVLIGIKAGGFGSEDSLFNAFNRLVKYGVENSQ